MYHMPLADIACRGAILYVHPFGDEMNKSRRMAAIQSRAFARAGYAVLQIDLYGCGDSDGELKEATWEIWQHDLATAVDWLHLHASPRISLWGLRLGATISIDYACKSDATIERCIVWQPVIAGRTYMTQFLRLILAEEMMSEAKEHGTQQLSRALAQDEMVEAGGYELSPALMAGIAAVDLSGLGTIPCPVHWLELMSAGQATPSAMRINTAREWMNRNIDVQLRSVAGPPFWATQEISECAALVSATIELLAEATA